MLSDLSQISVEDFHCRDLAIADHLSKLMGRGKG
jgi:hypothetical protein